MVIWMLAGCSPEATFDEMWAAVDEQYGVFDERLPDDTWDAVGERWRAALPEGASRDELFDVLIGMLRELDDGHTSLRAPLLGRDEDAWVSVYPHIDDLDLIADAVQAGHLDGGALSWGARDRIGWGTIGGDVGYLYLAEMEGHSLFADEEKDARAAGEAMDEALAALSGVEAMIVDVRANEGGWDTVSLEIAGHFADKQTLAWSKQRRNGAAQDAFSDWRDFHVAPSGGARFTGPIVVLTSGATFSAAETFTLAMRALPEVTIVGERTSGHFSDMRDGKLGNGWRYTLSSQRYRAADGNVYEAAGVPVDVDVPLDVDALRDGRDPTLEAALGLW